MTRKILWKKWNNPYLKKKKQDKDNDDESSPSMIRYTRTGIEVIPLDISVLSSYNYWVAHCNFDIDEQVASLIDDMPGVRSIEVMGPYEVRISIGLAFDEKLVRRRITHQLCKKKRLYHTDKEVLSQIAKAQVDLDIAGKPWIIYILPNGRFETFVSDDSNTYKDILSKYDYTANVIGGIVITS